MEKNEAELDYDFLFDAVIYEKFAPSARASKMVMGFDADVLFLKPYLIRYNQEPFSIVYWHRKGLL
jgi:hypothetical protein